MDTTAPDTTTVALVTATLTLLGTVVVALVTAILTARRDRKNWLREERLSAYAELWTAMQDFRHQLLHSLDTAEGPAAIFDPESDLWNAAHRADVAEGRVQVLAGRRVFKKIEPFSSAYADLHKAALREPERLDEAREAAEAARDGFVAVARSEIRGWRS